MPEPEKPNRGWNGPLTAKQLIIIIVVLLLCLSVYLSTRDMHRALSDAQDCVEHSCR